MLDQIVHHAGSIARSSRSRATLKWTNTIRSKIRPSCSAKRFTRRSDRNSASNATVSACRWTSAGPAVLIDFGGRIELRLERPASARERVGDVPTEMFRHFFKSFADAGPLQPAHRGRRRKRAPQNRGRCSRPSLARCAPPSRATAFKFRAAEQQRNAMITQSSTTTRATSVRSPTPSDGWEPNTGLPPTPAAIRAAERVLLPGVGEASSAMAKLRERGLVRDVIRSLQRSPCWASASACSCCAAAAKRAIPSASAFSTTRSVDSGPKGSKYRTWDGTASGTCVRSAAGRHSPKVRTSTTCTPYAPTVERRHDRHGPTYGETFSAAINGAATSSGRSFTRKRAPRSASASCKTF